MRPSQHLRASGPTRFPAEIVDRLNREVNAGLSDPGIRARLADLGGSAIGGSPADARGMIADEVAKWGKVIRAANIRPE
jgi:tripartite-type tricarboxylate transporter receptor subunit TctC